VITNSSSNCTLADSLTHSLTHLLTYLLTPWTRSFLRINPVLQPVKKFPAFYGTRRFITAFTSARHLSLPWASSIRSITPHPTSWRSTLILSSHLCLGLPSGPIPSGFPTKNLYTPLLSPHTHYMPADTQHTHITGGTTAVHKFTTSVNLITRSQVHYTPQRVSTYYEVNISSMYSAWTTIHLCLPN